MQPLTTKEKQNALNEVRILASIQHPSIVGYKEAFLESSENMLCIVMDFADDGDLYQKIQKCRKEKKMLMEDEIWRIIVGTVSGLQKLHDLNIFHRDIKSANVFLDKTGEARLGDLNVSKVAKAGILYTQTGTPYYASPEVWNDTPYSSQSDIWSLGCVFYESLALLPPFRASDMNALYKKVVKGVYEEPPSVYSNDLKRLIGMMINVRPDMRPTCAQILQSKEVQRNIKTYKISTSQLAMN